MVGPMNVKADGLWIRDALVDAYYDALPLVSVNLLWFMLTLPLVTAPPAAAGLYHTTNRLAHQRPANWRTFFEGFRTHFWLGWRWGLANLVVLSVLGGNYAFYGKLELSWGRWAQGLFLGLAMVWGLLQVYTFPLLLEQEDQRVLTAVRNSVVLYLQRPVFSLGLALLVVLLVGMSSLLPPSWLLITGSLCAYLTNRGTIVVLNDVAGPREEGC